MNKTSLKVHLVFCYKTCPQCHKTKASTAFHDDVCARDGMSHWCKRCLDKFREEVAPVITDEIRTRKKSYRKRVNDIKEHHGCTSCGQKFRAIVLEFHHKNTDEKLDTITNLIKYGYDWDVIETEIEKCVVLCANCHRLLHAEEKETVYDRD
jgi:hypothetical protein